MTTSSITAPVLRGITAHATQALSSSAMMDCLQDIELQSRADATKLLSQGIANSSLPGGPDEPVAIAGPTFFRAPWSRIASSFTFESHNALAKSSAVLCPHGPYNSIRSSHSRGRSAAASAATVDSPARLPRRFTRCRCGCCSRKQCLQGCASKIIVTDVKPRKISDHGGLHQGYKCGRIDVFIAMKIEPPKCAKRGVIHRLENATPQRIPADYQRFEFRELLCGESPSSQCRSGRCSAKTTHARWIGVPGLPDEWPLHRLCE